MSALPVLTRPTNSLPDLDMLPTQGMMVGETINLGMASSCKTDCTALADCSLTPAAPNRSLSSDTGKPEFEFCRAEPDTPDDVPD